MTSKQRLLMDKLKAFKEAKGYPPTYRELGVMCGGVSVGTIQGHIRYLEKLGYLTKNDRESRTLEIVKGVTW